MCIRDRNGINQQLEELNNEIKHFEIKISKNRGEIDAYIKENEIKLSKLNEEFDSYILELKALQTSSKDARNNVEKVRHTLEERLEALELSIRKLEDEIALLKIEAKKCCDKDSTPIAALNSTIDKQIVKLLKENLQNFSNGINNETKSTVTKQYIDEYLDKTLTNVKDEVLEITRRERYAVLKDELNKYIDSYLKEKYQIYTSDDEHTRNMLRDVITKEINLKNATGKPTDQVQEDLAVGLNRSQVEAIVRNALVLYDADKTGMFDFALETSGGAVVSTRCTKTYVERAASYTMFGGWLNLGWLWPLTMSTASPRNAIQPGVQPGQCWAFKGSEGRLVVSLSSPMMPRRFSVEHIPRSLSPKGRIDSAPRNFIVYGLMAEFDKEPVKLGEYEYDAVNGEPIQMFEVEVSEEENKQFKLIELEIKSNHGHPEYTCLYRFRVHGV